MNGYLSVIEILALDGQVGLYIGGSGLNTARVYPADAPQKAVFPHITVETFDADQFDTKSGVSVLEHEMVKVRYVAEEESDAYAMAQAGRTALDGKSGTYNGRYVEWIRYMGLFTYKENITNKSCRVHEHDYEVRVRNY